MDLRPFVPSIRQMGEDNIRTTQNYIKIINELQEAYLEIMLIPWKGFIKICKEHRRGNKS